LGFQEAHGREVVARFDGWTLTSDGGALLLREVERATGVMRQFTACFTDHRAAARVEHSVASQVAQRVYGLALGYEDLNDRDALRAGPLLAVLAGHADPTGATRRRARDIGKALAGKSTLNRLELTATAVNATERYKRITVDHKAVDRLFVELFVQAHATAPTEPVLDLDATDNPVHGQQEGRFFHGYYVHYCYLHSTFSPARICCVPTSVPRISTRVRARRRRWNASWRSSAPCGPMCGSCCAPTRASVATRCSRGVRRTRSTM